MMNKSNQAMAKQPANPQSRTGTASAQEWYLGRFAAFEATLNGAAASSVHALRRDAIARFAETGFPTTRNEEWKYTDVSPIARVNFQPSSLVHRPTLTLRDIGRFLQLVPADGPCFRLVCVDGHFAPELSVVSALPRGVEMVSLAAALADGSQTAHAHLGRYARIEDNGFSALSTAFLHDGVMIAVPSDVVLDTPIHVLNITTDHNKQVMIHPRVLIVAGRSSQLSVLETHVSLGQTSHFNNTVTELVLAENSVVDYTKYQDEASGAHHVGSTCVHQERNSTLSATVISLGGGLVRNNVVAVLDGEGATSTLNGLYLAGGSQHVDNHTTIDHARPHCNSFELYKGILGGKSRGVFNGKIIVRKDAQKTDAKQTNKNLLLSDEATIDTKPQLEIHANDVKCTHGATVGQLDEEALFYLRSRGLGLDMARDMMIYAFASDVVERLKMNALRDHLHHAIYDRLHTARQETRIA